MFLGIQTLQFGHVTDSQAYGTVDSLEDNQHRYAHEGKTRDNPQALDAELPKAPSIKTAALVQDSPALSAAAREREINDYFRSANENVGAFDCDLVIHERDVSTSLKAVVKARDGYRCVICGSTHQLEVDHRRALMNGGDNTEGNLATLCDDCHTAKTRMDNSLRRKRERVCR